MRGASSSSETAVSFGGLGLSGLGVSRGIAFLLCVLLGSMRSLLSGRPRGDWNGVPESRREKIKIRPL